MTHLIAPASAAPSSPVRRAITTACLLTVTFLSRPAPAAPDWSETLRQPNEWFQSGDGRRVIENVLSHQTPRGDWPKNTDTLATPGTGDPARLRGTFDNGATVREVRLLARAATATDDARCREGVERAIRHILAAQYDNGGWPQSYPPGTGYSRHVTFNDNTMVNLMELMRDASHADAFRFLDRELRDRALDAFDRGIDCIVRCQILVDGTLTAWCAQHDEHTLEPRPARAFEPASLSGGESAGLLFLLMSLRNPSPLVSRAIQSGAAWFENAALTGIRYVERNDDRVVVPDPEAGPLWARFYQIGSNRPIFTGRDGVIRFQLAEIEHERRTGYKWYGSWGRRVATAFAQWSATRSGNWGPDHLSDEEGFTPLLDGTAASQWRQCGPGRFDLENGIATGQGGMGLWWYAARPFTNFVLRGEFLQEEPLADSGVFIRFPDPGNDPWEAVHKGHEVEIGDPQPEDPTWRTGSIYPFCASLRANTRPAGEWNTYQIACVRHHYAVWINGDMVTAWVDPGRRSRHGFLGLQNYDDAKTVRHRNLRIKDLP
jgi:pectate lyase